MVTMTSAAGREGSGRRQNAAQPQLERGHRRVPRGSFVIRRVSYAQLLSLEKITWMTNAKLIYNSVVGNPKRNPQNALALGLPISADPPRPHPPHAAETPRRTQVEDDTVNVHGRGVCSRRARVPLSGQMFKTRRASCLVRQGPWESCGFGSAHGYLLTTVIKPESWSPVF